MKLNKMYPVRLNDETLELAMKNCEKQNTTIANEIRQVVKKWSECKIYIDRKEID